MDMKKGRVLKEGLIQYRIVCQAINVASLEEVIKHLLKLAHERAETAQAAAASSTALEVCHFLTPPCWRVPRSRMLQPSCILQPLSDVTCTPRLCANFVASQLSR